MSESAGAFAPLRGVQILDFTSNAAGPYATWLLSMLGAKVLKVESHTRPDPTRGISDRPYAHSVFFEDLNGGKNCVTLDMKTPQGRARAHDLAAKSHAVVDSFRPGVMARWGLDAEGLHAHFPHLVVASFSATGAVGPYAGLPGYAGVFNALGGLGALTGYRDGPATELRTSIDLRTGAVFALAVAQGLQIARRTGVGETIDFSATEAVALLCGDYLAAHLLGGAEPDLRVGNEHELWAPQGIYRTDDDSWLAISCTSDAHWRALTVVLGESGIRVPATWDDLPRRHAARSAVDDKLSSWCAGLSGTSALARLREAGIPSDFVLDARGVAEDEHLWQRGLYQHRSAVGESGDCIVASVPWLVEGSRPLVGTPEALGHSDDRDLEPMAPIASLPDRPLRVLEIGRGVETPMAGRLLAYLGCDVVRLDRGGDDWTVAKPPVVEVDGVRAGALHHFLHAGKRVVGWSVDDGETLLRLWAWADVVVVDHEHMALADVQAAVGTAGPATVVVTSPYGLSGPRSANPGTSMLAFAQCGEASITPGGLGNTRFPERGPLAARGELAGFDTGVVAALLAVTGAATAADRPVPPTLLDVSVHEVEVSNNRWIPSNYHRSGWIESRTTRPYPFGGLTPCKDGYVMILAATDAHWRSLVEIMGNPDWASNDDLSTLAGRVAAAPAAGEHLTEWAAQLSKADLLERALAAGVPVGPYRTVPEVAACPHLAQRHFFVPYGTTDDTRRVPGFPVPQWARVDGIPAPVRLEATDLQHYLAEHDDRTSA